MSLAEHYPLLRHAHVGLVATSVSVFAARTLAALAGADWPHRRTWRLASAGIDTALLAAGVTLAFLLGLEPFGRDAWLGTKIVLLLVYIVLGAFALTYAKRRAVRIGCFVAALGCFGFMATVAVSHHPLGVLRGASN